MGLSMTLPEDKNCLAMVFTDAYWAISELSYDVESVRFTLSCYPSREAKLLAGSPIQDMSIKGFGRCDSFYSPELYRWKGVFSISAVFPEGIPLGRDAQLTMIYRFIKEYTKLPFEDVFEDVETEIETVHEESSVESEPETAAHTPAEPELPAAQEPESEAAQETEPEPTGESIESDAEPISAAEPENVPEPEPTLEPEHYHNPLSL